MSINDHTADNTGESQSRQYHLILEEASSNPKVRGAIQDRAGVSRETADTWMKHPPSVILDNRPLQDVVELRSLLMRLGASARIEEMIDSNKAEETPDPTPADVTYQVIESTQLTASPTDIPIDPDKSPDQWFPEQKKIPTTKVSSGSLYGSRIWTCFVSVAIIALVLSAFTVGMFYCMKSNSTKQDKTGSDQFSPPESAETLIPLPPPVSVAKQIDKLSQQANAVLKNKNGEEARKILDDYDNLNELQDLSEAFAHFLEALSPEEILPREEYIAQDRKDITAASDSLTETTPELFPATLSALQQLSDQHQLKEGPKADWEITGTVLSARTNLPENTQLKVEVRAPGKDAARYHLSVIKGAINLPIVEYYPVGTISIQIRILPVESQPESVRLSSLGLSELQPDEWVLKSQFTIEEELFISNVPALKDSPERVSLMMSSKGFHSFVSLPDIDRNASPMLVIEGKSEDPFLFIKSAVQASGLITMSVNDPANWVLIRINSVDYWIESYHCRVAMQDFTESESALNSYILNHLYHI